jgi:galactokinase/galacturonokinase
VTPEQARTLDSLREDVADASGAPAGSLRAVVSPYRVCPIGAHLDHQHGPVLGMAIEAGTCLAFAPAPDARCRIASRNFEGVEHFAVDRPGAPGQGWGRYPRAAAWALASRLPARPRGIVAALHGALPGCGLGSSASLLLACLRALAEANEIELSPAELVSLSCQAENGYVGLASGVLDPAAIVAARRGRLALIDTARTAAGQAGWESIAPGTEAPDFRVVVAASGRTRNLTGTGFNQRVAECRAAARALAALAGIEGVERLGDLPEAILSARLAELPAIEQRRARHFHEERARVREGARRWRAGDLAGFGQLMAESCQSSIANFETGSPELVELHRLLAAAGALGSRFSGAGYAGCAFALVAAERAEACRDQVAQAWTRAHPELAAGAPVFVSECDDGLRMA